MSECCPLNHVYIHRFRSIIEATEKFPQGWGHLISWNGPTCIMGHLNSFLGLERGEFEHKFSKNSIALGGGGGCLSFDLTGIIISVLTHQNLHVP